jgi:hypothetical protein
MKRTTSLYILLTASLIFAFASCDPNASHKTLGNSTDTTSVNKAGGPPIRDTATINKDRRDSAANPRKATTGKGNADPSGHIKNQ